MNPSEGADEGDDLLGDFFSEVEKVSEKSEPIKSDEANDKSGSNTNQIKNEINNLGTSTFQIDRLLQDNFE